MRDWLFIPKVDFMKWIGLLVVFSFLSIAAAGCFDSRFWKGPKGNPTDPPDGPFYYKAEYDEVWDAAVETVGELGFVIVLLNREEGFISTDKKDTGMTRYVMSVRIKRVNGYVAVKPNALYESAYLSPTRDGPIVKEWGLYVARSAYYEWDVGKMISKKIGKPYVILKSDGPAGADGVKDPGGK